MKYDSDNQRIHRIGSVIKKEVAQIVQNDINAYGVRLSVASLRSASRKSWWIKNATWSAKREYSSVWPKMGAETSEMRPAGHWSRPEGATAGSRAQLRIASVALHVPCVGCEIDTSTRARASARPPDWSRLQCGLQLLCRRRTLFFERKPETALSPLPNMHSLELTRPFAVRKHARIRPGRVSGGKDGRFSKSAIAARARRARRATFDQARVVYFVGRGELPRRAGGGSGASERRPVKRRGPKMSFLALAAPGVNPSRVAPRSRFSSRVQGRTGSSPWPSSPSTKRRSLSASSTICRIDLVLPFEPKSSFYHPLKLSKCYQASSKRNRADYSSY